MTGRWVSPVGHDRTRPVVIFRFWYLTGNDRTLVLVCPVTSSSASSHHLTVGIERSVFEERGHVTCIARPNAGVQRPIDLTGASGHPMLCPVKG